MRVLLLKWKTIDLSPKKEGSSRLVEEYRSMYLPFRQYLGMGRMLSWLSLLVAVGLTREVAELATEVARLASLLLGGIARRHLTALVGIKMSACSSAVAVVRDALLVDVVHFNSQYTRAKIGFCVTH
jgi:hypothetical protein